MKLRAPEELVEDIRKAIAITNEKIVVNKTRRKALIVQIRKMKSNIRTGEAICSKLEVGLVIDTEYLRDDLAKKRESLTGLRLQLLTEELHASLEKARFRTLHKQLDKLRVPFDPEAFKAKHKGT
jgi:energy-converting hydrogenase A subunit M